ncbi:O-antigen ligase family protein [Armatimonas rosea]|uniref:O-antigen ligase n=1 Tax=Armatimonas rosea TaxID=685828 RepID=A0A7W9W855_ARMRO|nr:O-antigen ligase family protein [Armatimonas rosea]MBB6053164.1 O-antigen ligase [Armatimonas rosea]
MPSLFETAPAQQSDPTNPSKTPPILIFLIVLVVPIILSYELITVKETYVFSITLAAIGGLVIFARPFWGLILFVMLLYIRPEESIQEIQGIRLPFIISVTTLLSALIHKLVNREKIQNSPLNFFIVGFSFFAIASSMQSNQLELAMTDISKNAILVLLIINLVNTPKKFRIFSQFLILLTGYLATYSIYLYQTGSVLVRDNEFQALATGIFSDPNDLSATIVAGLGMSLFQTRSDQKSVKFINFVLSILFFFAITLTNSRGGLLATILTINMFIYQTSQNKKISIIIIIMSSLLILASLGGRIVNFDSTEASANSRFWFWSTGIEVFIQRPLLGIGYGGFPDINGGMTAHNSFVLCFTETGLIGYFFWVGCILYNLTISISKNPKKDYTSNNSETLSLAGSKLALSGYLIAIFWISRTYISNFYILMSMPTAYYISHTQVNTTHKSHTIKPLNIISICIISIITIYIIAIIKR